MQGIDWAVDANKDLTDCFIKIYGWDPGTPQGQTRVCPTPVNKVVVILLFTELEENG